MKINTRHSIFYFLFSKFLSRFSLVILFSIFYFITFYIPAFAAEVFLDSKTREIGVGSQFEVSVFLNTENEDINAIEGKLFFSQDTLEPREIKDGNSIVNFWLERPKPAEEMVFSGITPGGYIGNRGLIFSAVFYAKKEGISSIEIREPKILLNDGQGTETKVKTSALQIVVSSAASSVLAPTSEDRDPPEDFLPQIAADPAIFDGKWFLVFATQDKGSGIDHYEVCEGKKQCVIAESPYLLKNQNLDEKIIIKAIDKNGNERIVTLPAQKPSVWYKNYLILAIIIILIATGYFVGKFLWRKYKR